MKKTSYFIVNILLILISQSSYSQAKLSVEGSIHMQSSADTLPDPGTIRWSGKDFEGWNGLTCSSFTGNSEIGSVTDIDGNEYSTIRIGSQIWMAENLRTTRYNDGVGMDEIRVEYWSYWFWSLRSGEAIVL